MVSSLLYHRSKCLSCDRVVVDSALLFPFRKMSLPFPTTVVAICNTFRNVPFFMRREGSEDFMAGDTFFCEPKKGGGHVFFQNLILNIFFKKVCNIRNQSTSGLFLFQIRTCKDFVYYISHTAQYSKICLLINSVHYFLTYKIHVLIKSSA